MAENKLKSLNPIKGAQRSLRSRLNLKGELILALLPTITVLVVFSLVEVFSKQRLLFASLASSAFLIYLDPHHGTNSIRTLVIAQMSAATIGLVIHGIVGNGYFSGGIAMVIIIVWMIIVDAMHPPAVATALSFAFRAGDESNLVLFAMAVGITTVLIILERVAVWILAKYLPKEQSSENKP